MTKNKTDTSEQPNEPTPEALPPTDVWIQDIKFNTTEEIKVPENLLDHVIGQDETVAIVKKAAEQKRHVMLIGDPGTGKSMVARAMPEFLPKGELEDIIVYPNNEDTNTPTIRVVPAGKAHEIIRMHREEAKRKVEQQNSMILGSVWLSTEVFPDKRTTSVAIHNRPTWMLSITYAQRSMKHSLTRHTHPMPR